MFCALEIFQHTSEQREPERPIRSLQRQYKTIIRRYQRKNGLLV
jgi:hypothetical protein